ncbi:hypothetical protein JOE50_002843 [Bradyrhizobium japonicum]|nr:hypothetical protein [Bradyrhizobium japonicum]
MQAADFSATLQNLFAKGVRYGAVIDLGCAEGISFLTTCHGSVVRCRSTLMPTGSMRTP